MLAISGGFVRAGTVEDGLAAYQRGDYAIALRLWRPLAAQGNAAAQNDIGWAYLNGKGVPKDYSEAVKWLRLSAAQGNAAAQTNLGWMYQNGVGVPQDYDQAVKWSQLAATQGEALAQTNLGLMYAKRQGVSQDYEEAVRLFRLSAAQGNALAQTTLGWMYQNGQGVPQDYDEAVRFYRLAAAQGNAIAQTDLGLMYQFGQGVSQDYEEAVKLHRLAVAQGNAMGQNNLAFMYLFGQGVPPDDKEAVKLFRLAAAQGNATAQSNLGEMYANGRGVPRDYVHSYMWLAISNGVANSVKLLPQITRNITPTQIALGRKLAEQCKKTNYKRCGEPEGSQPKPVRTTKEVNQTVSSATPLPTPREGNQTSPSATSVPMQSEGGIYVVPVLINNAITLDFVVDSGAADVSIPADVVLTLMRTGTLKAADFQGEQKYTLADGSTVPSQTFRIRSLKVGNKVLENVNGSVASVNGSLLLGQSFLGRFKSWSVDNAKHALILEAAE